VYGGLYLERLSFKKHVNYLKLNINKHMNITNFHDFSKTLGIFFSSHDFSRPGSNHFKFPLLFQVFHERKICEYERAYADLYLERLSFKIILII